MNGDIKFIVVLTFVMFLCGWFSNEIYTGLSNRPSGTSILPNENLTFEGLRLSGVESHPEAMRKAESYNKGDWVCVNVEKIDYRRAFEVCAHEVGHEIFAEYCEDNIQECLNLTEVGA